MLNFHLFRVKVYPTNQMDLFEKERRPSEILRETILSFPSVELRKGKIWQIGNVTAIDDFGIYFRVGRVSESKIEVYQNGKFLDTQFESAPYTHVLLDVVLEICALARKSRLSPKVTGITNQLVRLLNQSEKGRQFEARFEVVEINDPEDFIAHIQHAFSISKFWITFSRPNPFDIDSEFIKPMEKFLDSANGEKGKAEVKGESLNPERLEELARSAASTGDEAAAWMQLEPNTKKIKKNLKGNPVILPQEDLVTYDQMVVFLQNMRDLYEKIRGILGMSNDQ